jgi:hypothetical protein
MADIKNDSVVVAAKDQVSCDLDGEAAVLNLATGTYYGLDRVGATIWQHIQTPASIRDIGEALVTRYEVDAITAKSDLVSFLTEMMQEGLVELLPDEASLS